MAFTSRTLEITVISAENLQIDGKSIRKNAYVIVKSDDSQLFRTTEIDEGGGSFPSWNEKLVLDLTMHARFMTVEVHCRTAGRTDRVVGTARVPVSDFVGGYVPESYLHFLSYRLRDTKGEKNGIVNISVRMKVPSCSTSGCSSGKQGSLIEVGEKIFGGGGGAVTGIPVWFA